MKSLLWIREKRSWSVISFVLLLCWWLLGQLDMNLFRVKRVNCYSGDQEKLLMISQVLYLLKRKGTYSICEERINLWLQIIRKNKVLKNGRWGWFGLQHQGFFYLFKMAVFVCDITNVTKSQRDRNRYLKPWERRIIGETYDFLVDSRSFIKSEAVLKIMEYIDLPFPQLAILLQFVPL